MTEDEAKTKICCGPLLMSETWLNEERLKKVGGELKVGRCIGSECMAWRTTKVDRLSQVQIGHCGLAGRPT